MEFDLENPLKSLVELNFDALPSLFQAESDHMPTENYIRNLMSEVSDFNLRREVISIILQFNYDFEPVLCYLAINYLDRFLSSQGMPQSKPWIIRLLAVSCVSLAAKMKETEFSMADLQPEGGLIFDAVTIQRMEVLILGALNWRMRSITPFSFIPFFISLFKIKDPQLIQALKARATEIILKAQTEIKILEFRPSIVAASALLSASHELFPMQIQSFKRNISKCSCVNSETLMSCYSIINDIAIGGYISVSGVAGSSETPVNVLDRHCLSYESEVNTTSTEATTGMVRVETGVKRRRIGDFCNEKTFQLSQIQGC